jgi:ubiquinol-cytochrome c reductase iron-sulfur subunit
MTQHDDALPDSPEGTRRDFIYIATGAIAAVGAAISVWPLIDQMEPAADTLAAGAPRTVDLSSVEPGQQIVVMWRSKPIFVVHRTPEMLQTIKSKQDLALLSDPDSKAHQQPPYAQNWSRSLKPEWLVLVGICTHLGCIPDFKPDPKSVSADWPGGYFCPCHGSKYDLCGRVFTGVPAPLNLPVPPYHFPNDSSVVIGANPEGVSWELSSVEQM